MSLYNRSYHLGHLYRRHACETHEDYPASDPLLLKDQFTEISVICQ